MTGQLVRKFLQVNAAGTPFEALAPAAYDEVVLDYTGDDPTTVTYKNDGATVATLTLSYSGGKLIRVVKS